MPQPCKVCRHPQKLEIDRGLLAGRPKRALALAFAVSADSVERHARKHVTQALAAATEGREALYGNKLIEQLVELQNETKAILREARFGEKTDNRTALKAIGQAIAQLELQARLTGELKDKQVNQALVILDPEQALRIAETYVSTKGAGRRREAETFTDTSRKALPEKGFEGG